MVRPRLALLLAGSALLGFGACRDGGPHGTDDAAPERGAGALYVTLEGVAVDAGPRAPAAVRLPHRADEPIAIRDVRSGMGARFRLIGAAPSDVAIDGTLARYRDAVPGGGDLTVVARADGVEDYISVARAPSVPIAYELEVGEAAGLRHVGRSLELLDAQGAPRLRVLPPWVRDAEGRTHRAELVVEGCDYDPSPHPPWGRPVVAPGSDRCRLTIPWPDSVKAYPAVLDPAWVSAAAMDANRAGHTVSTVGEDHPECGDGPFVVVVGGFRLDNGQARRSVELYHPATETWCQGADLITGRARHSATFVDTTGFDKGPNQPGGPRLSVAGGLSFFSDPASFIANYESLDLVTWTWATGTIWLGRADHQALAATNNNGEPRLVIVGGNTTFGRTNVAQQIDVDALIPPIAFAQPLAYLRAGHTMTRLDDAPLHQHLVVGGCSLSESMGDEGGGGGMLPNEPPCESWEIYCPFTGCSQEGDDLPRLLLHEATRTSDGVVVTGGVSNVFTPLATAWRFDIATTSWSPLPDMPIGRRSHTGSALADGTVLVAGGVDRGGGYLAQAHRLSADGSAWQPAGELDVARSDHGASVLPSGAVLVMGGEGDVLGTAELYIPCDRPEDCPEDTYCSLASRACSELEPNGTPCLDATPCASGLCVDGFCCDQACDGECDACNIVGDEGECSELPPSLAPPACLPVDSCLDEVTFVSSKGEVVDCGAFRCVGSACLTSCNASADCAPGFVCDPGGDCVPPPPSSGGSCGMARGTSPPEGELGWLVIALGVAIRSRRADRRRG